jgi:hypothetical protein
MKASKLRERLYLVSGDPHVVIMVDGYKLRLTMDNIYQEDRWLYITPEMI